MNLARRYGYLTPDPHRLALILDGDFTRDRLEWLYYDRDLPRREPTCMHATEWDSLPGQYSHPHPLADPTGRWISLTRASGGSSDVCIATLRGG